MLVFADTWTYASTPNPYRQIKVPALTENTKHCEQSQHQFTTSNAMCTCNMHGCLPITEGLITATLDDSQHIWPVKQPISSQETVSCQLLHDTITIKVAIHIISNNYVRLPIIWFLNNPVIAYLYLVGSKNKTLLVKNCVFNTCSKFLLSPSAR